MNTDARPLPMRLFCGLLTAYFLLCAPMSVLASGSTPTPVPSVTSPSPSEPPVTATPAPTVNPEYEDMVIRLGDQGPMVELLQQRLRDLQYFTYKVTDYYGGVTERAVRDFQRQHGLSADGVFGGKTAALLFSNEAEPSTGGNFRIPTPTPSPTPKPNVVPQYGQLVEWSTARNFIAHSGGASFRAKDVRTGKTFRLIRIGGTNHMDIVPASRDDAAAYKAAYGGSWSWDRRAVIVQFNGKWYAASVNGWPHGSGRQSLNGVNGHFCLHFKNSRTHGTNSLDAAHQRCVRAAAGQ